MFFTTINLTDGKFDLIELHLDRIISTQKIFFGNISNLDLDELLEDIPSQYPKGNFRVRVDYSSQINQVKVYPYTIKELKKLKFIENACLDYSYKYADRKYFEDILNQNPEVDDIIFTQNGYLTDTTFCNILLKKNLQWFTPKSYLLAGTKRQFLLNKGIVEEMDIHQNDLSLFSEICFINAMRDFEKIYKFELNNSFLNLTPLNA